MSCQALVLAVFIVAHAWGLCKIKTRALVAVNGTIVCAKMPTGSEENAQHSRQQRCNAQETKLQ
jgi:hypothetical protein